MTGTRCQICGRKKHLRKDRTIVHHCVGGPRCPGSGHPPIEQDDAFLVSYAAQIETAFDRAYQAVRDLEERRANWIDPALIMRRGALAGMSLKIGRRLKRIQTWAERYARTYDRHMMEQGCCWADKPPEYLIARYVKGFDILPPAYRMD